MFGKLKALYVAWKESKKVKEAYMGKLFEREFLLTVLTAVAAIYASVQGMISPELTAKVLVVLSTVFTVARSIVKLTSTTKDDEILAKVEEILKGKKLLK